MKGFPDDIENLTVIDGASVIRVFFTMTVPMSKQSMMTIPVVLTMFKGQYTTDYVSMLAAIVIAILPSLLICFPLISRLLPA